MNYSDTWFKTVNKETLEIEREKVRRAFCNSGNAEQKAEELQNLLYKFDDALRKFEEQTTGFPAHREHGWYLEV